MIYKPTRRDLIHYGVTGAAGALAVRALSQTIPASVRWPVGIKRPTGVTVVSGGISLLSSIVGPATPALNGGVSGSINTTGASLLVMVMSTDNAVGTGGYPTISDSKSNTWVQLGGQGANPSVNIIYVQNPTVGTGHTFTVAGTGSAPGFAVFAFSGMVLSGVFESGSEKGNFIGSGATTVQATSPTTPGSGNQLIVSALGQSPASAGGTFTVDSGFSTPLFLTYNSGINYGTAAAWKTQVGSATTNPTWTCSVSSSLATDLACFQGV